MKLHLNRHFLGPKYTIGKLYIDEEYFCDILEDPVRDLNKNGVFDNGETKIYANSAIPYGEYNITLPVSPRFKRKLPRLMNVPHFEGILIHRGNTPENTEGCLLVGENKVKGKVINSTPYEIKLVELMEKALNNNQIITIKIT